MSPGASGLLTPPIPSTGEVLPLVGLGSWIDFAHHPRQLERLDWGSSVDSDPAQARAARERVWAQEAEAGALAIGIHFATPTAERVKHLPQGGFWLDVKAV